MPEPSAFMRQMRCPLPMLCVANIIVAPSGDQIGAQPEQDGGCPTRDDRPSFRSTTYSVAPRTTAMCLLSGDQVNGPHSGPGRPQPDTRCSPLPSALTTNSG